MAIRDEDFGATLTSAEADDEAWSPPVATPAFAPSDLRSLYEQVHARAEQERARADAAEAHAEELHQAEVAARSRAGSLKSQLDKSRNKLNAAIEETKEVRRAAKDALFFQAEVVRLEELLSEAGVESSRRSTIMSLRREVAQLREALRATEARKDTKAPPSGGSVRPPKVAPVLGAGKDTTGPLSGEDARLRKSLERAQNQKDEIVSLRRETAALRKSERAAQASLCRESARLCKALERSQEQTDTIKSLRREVRSLNHNIRQLHRELEWSENLKETAARLSDEAIQLRGELRGYHDQTDIIDLLSRRVSELRIALIRSATGKQCLEAELANRPLLPAAFRQLRDQDKTIEALRARNERLEAQLTKLRSTRTVLSKALFGSKSERQKQPGTGANAASSAARPATAAPGGPSSGRRPNGATRRRMRACVPVAASPMSPTASVPRPSSRSRSRPTPAGSSGRAGAGVATARPRPWR